MFANKLNAKANKNNNKIEMLPKKGEASSDLSYDQTENDRKKRFDYLLKKSEIFSNFLSCDYQTKSKKKRPVNKNNNSTTNNNNNTKNNNKNDVEEQPKAEVQATSSTSNENIVTFSATPDYITGGVMRDYQLDGLNWLISLYENGVNGILADEMGLGKTLQSISILGFLKHFKNISGPHLIVVPKTTVHNWGKEIERWCPSLKAIQLFGEKNARSVLKNSVLVTQWDICVTTYEIFLIEISTIKKFKWRYVIIDEAHRIKNENTKLARFLRQINSTNRLLLTGTPIQNDLHELWALLNFLLPDVFTSSDDFDECFNLESFLDTDDDSTAKVTLVQRLHTILNPFLLRRVKCDVEHSLLPKQEYKIFVQLSDMQRELYKKLLLKEFYYNSNQGDKKKMRLEYLMVHLSKCTNHPYLFDDMEPGPPYSTDMHIITSSGKMVVLDKLLSKLHKQGSRVLIFLRFRKMLTILEDYFIWRGYKYSRLDGSTKYEERDNKIEEFNSPGSETFIFMLSTRSGGLGINLYTADAVIFYDSDWNPQVDLQAMDRAHRIGQKKQVRVFRLITEHTVDEKINEVAELKLRLDNVVIGQQFSKKDFSKNELMGIVRFGANEIFSKEGNQLVDEDIDTILERGKIKTQAKQTRLNEFFERAIKNPESVIEAFVAADDKEQCKLDPKDFQFFPKRLHDLLAIRRPLTEEEKKERDKLCQSGFGNWDLLDFEQFVMASAKYGRDNIRDIAQDIDSKNLTEVTQYINVFWKRCNELKNFVEVIKRIEEGEKYLKRKLSVQELLNEKLSNYRAPLRQMRFDYSLLQNNENANNNNRNGKSLQGLTQQEDGFLIYTLSKLGADEPNVYDRLWDVIKKSAPFSATSAIKKLSKAAMKKHCQLLIDIIRIESEQLEEQKINARPALKRMRISDN